MNIKLERFCQAIVDGASVKEAAETAGYCLSYAYKLRKKKEVQKRIQSEYKNELECKRSTKEKLIEWLEDVIFTDQGNIEDIEAVNYVVKNQPRRVKRAICGITRKQTKYGQDVEVKRWNALAAAKLLADICGMTNANEEENEPITLNVKIS